MHILQERDQLLVGGGTCQVVVARSRANTDNMGILAHRHLGLQMKMVLNVDCSSLFKASRYNCLLWHCTDCYIYIHTFHSPVFFAPSNCVHPSAVT